MSEHSNIASASNVKTTSCEYWIINGAVPTADTDISGIGVILAFLLSAYLTFTLVLVAYLLGSIDKSLLRPVDLYVHRLPASRRTSPSWHRAIQQCVLIFSDQQIVTGIAICVAGFVGLGDKISVYHFQIVISLAWMSSSVHLSALTMLGQYFQERPAVLGWRISGMMVLFVLLLVALVPTASNLWAIQWTLAGDDYSTTGWAVPAICYFFDTYGTGVNPDAPLSYTLLIISYAWKIGALFQNSRRTFHRYIRGPHERFLERILRKEALKAGKRRPQRKRFSWKYYAAMVVYIVLLALFDFCASFAASLWLSAIGLVYGTVQIAIPRMQNSWWNLKEDTWGFGQIVPLILLIQPLGALLENYRSRRLTRQDVSEEYELSNGALSYPRPQDRPSHMSEYFAAIDPVQASQRSLEVLDHQMAFYHSFLFTSLIVWIEIAVAVISCVVFYFDVRSIGNEAAHSWYWVLILSGIFLGGAIIWTVAAIPFSRVFK